MVKERITRISLLVVAIVGVTALALAFSVGTSAAQGPGSHPGNTERGGYGPGDGLQGVPPEGYGLGTGEQFGYNAGVGVNLAAGFDNQPILDVVAAALGMDSADVFALRQTGMTYAEIAADQGIDLETLIDLLVTQHQATLQAQLNEGLLSLDQVTWMQAEMRENIRERLTTLWEVSPSLGDCTGFYGDNTLN